MFGFVLGSQRVGFKTITIASDQVDWNLITDGFGGVAPTRRTVVTITVNSGINLTSSSNAIPSMDLTGLPANSEINLINLGNIYGRGGNGGKGEGCVAVF